MFGRLKLVRALALAGALLLVAVPAASGFSKTEYRWRIVSVSAPYTTYGGWSFCSQSHGGSVTCSRAFTVANTVTGSLGVSDGLLSATLGYSVTTSTTLTGGATYQVPAHKIGVAQWRALYATRAVHQRLYEKTWLCNIGCVLLHSWSATNRYETAYANRYVGPDFRVVIH